MRRALLVTLVLLELFIGFGGLYGGGALVLDPSGARLGMTTTLLARSPFSTFVVPGVVLFIVNGLVPLLVVLVTALRVPWSRWAHVAVGALLSGWMMGQVLMIGLVMPIQTVFVGLGLLVLALAGVALWLERRVAAA